MDAVGTCISTYACCCVLVAARLHGSTPHPPPLTTPLPSPARQAGQVLELAVYLSVKQGDEAAFERNYAQVGNLTATPLASLGCWVCSYI